MNLFREPYRKTSKILREALDLVDNLTGATARLTTTFWAGKWRGAAFRDEALARLRARLDEILGLRTVHTIYI